MPYYLSNMASAKYERSISETSAKHYALLINKFICNKYKINLARVVQWLER